MDSKRDFSQPKSLLEWSYYCSYPPSPSCVLPQNVFVLLMVSFSQLLSLARWKSWVYSDQLLENAWYQARALLSNVPCGYVMGPSGFAWREVVWIFHAVYAERTYSLHDGNGHGCLWRPTRHAETTTNNSLRVSRWPPTRALRLPCGAVLRISFHKGWFGGSIETSKEDIISRLLVIHALISSKYIDVSRVCSSMKQVLWNRKTWISFLQPRL